MASELVKSLRIDYQHGMRQAVQRLAALGHVRIAFISGPVHQRTAAMRRAAFQECMTEIGLRTIPELLFAGDHTMEGGMKAMSALGALPDRLSAVICSNDLTAIGVMRQAFDPSVSATRPVGHGVRGPSHGTIHDSGVNRGGDFADRDCGDGV